MINSAHLPHYHFIRLISSVYFSRLWNHLKWYVLRKTVAPVLHRPTFWGSCLVSTANPSTVWPHQCLEGKTPGDSWETGSEHRARHPTISLDLRSTPGQPTNSMESPQLSGLRPTPRRAQNHLKCFENLQVCQPSLTGRKMSEVRLTVLNSSHDLNVQPELKKTQSWKPRHFDWGYTAHRLSCTLSPSLDPLWQFGVVRWAQARIPILQLGKLRLWEVTGLD